MNTNEGKSTMNRGMQANVIIIRMSVIDTEIYELYF